MTPVKTPTAPHPVNPARPRPLPGPPKPPPPQPRPRFVFAALSVSAVCISSGLALIVAPLGSTTQAWALPTDYTADLLLVPLFIVFLVVSLALAPRAPRHRPLRFARAGAVAVPGTAATAPTKPPPSRS